MFLRKILRQNEVNNKYTPDYKLFLNFIYLGKFELRGPALASMS